MDFINAQELLKKYDQEQLLDYYVELDEAGRSRLLAQIEKIDFSSFDSHAGSNRRKLGKISPVPAVTIEETERDRDKFIQTGRKVLKAGKAAAVLLAGGQGTRLGSDKPKGVFNIGITRELSIFEQQFENIKQVTDDSGCFHVFIMTSEINNSDTIDFFRQKNYFGYPEDKIHFFVQEMAPASDFNGKIYLDQKDSVSFSPNGNGGWYVSLINSGLGDIIKSEGIEWLNVYSVDNVLQRICDPVFIGATVSSGYNCGAKVVKKAAPDERVGVLCLENNKPAIIEYYEIPSSLASMRNEDGELVYCYGVILNYLFKVNLLDKTIEAKLPVHLSEKKIPFMYKGERIIPSEPNGYKRELLVLDMIKLMGDCLAVEVERDKEFAPVKNRTGIDSVDTARELLKKNGVKL